MTVIANIRYRINGAVHAHTGFTRSIMPTSEDDLIDPEGALVSIECDGLKAEFKLIHGDIDNPLNPGQLWWGFNAIDLKITSECEWPDLDSLEFDKLSNRIHSLADVIKSRFVAYLKYEKGHPFIRGVGEIIFWHWEDADGVLLHEENIHLIDVFPGLKGELQTKPMRNSDLAKLEAYFNEDPKITVVDELLLQAKEAIFERNVPKAVLLLAVSVEVRVKTAFLGGRSAASDAFDHSQSKGKVVVSPIEFLHEIAEITLGESFKRFNNDAFLQVDYLFRCRNKVAHRGTAKFRDNKGVEVKTDVETVTAWWDAVSVLFQWLSANSSRLNSQ